MLTDDQKAEAKTLGLTQQEARFSLATRIPLTRYAKAKAELAAGRDAENALMEGLAAAVTNSLPHANDNER